MGTLSAGEVTCMLEGSRLRLGLGGLATVGAAAGAYLLWLRPWHLRWGATEEEVRRPMQGDDEVPNPILQATRAITIAAPPGEVWPWLVQMGRGRAGFYGYDRPSADRLVPELQHLAPGDSIPTGRGEALTVHSLEPNRSLLLGLYTGSTHLSASILLREVDLEHTRVLVRLRAWWRLGWREGLSLLIFDPSNFISMRRQLLGLKARAEQRWAQEQHKVSPARWGPGPGGTPGTSLE